MNTVYSSIILGLLQFLSNIFIGFFVVYKLSISLGQIYSLIFQF